MKKNILFGVLLFGAVGAFFSGSALVFFNNSHQANVLEAIKGFLKGFSDPGADQDWGILGSSGLKADRPAEEISLYKPAIDYEEAVVRAIEKSEPSVVSIVVSKDLPVIEQCPNDPFGNLPPEFKDFFGGFNFNFSQPCQKGTAKQEIGGGSGFIVSADGLVVTNKHVVYDAKAEYTVLTNDGEKHPAKVLASDPVQDLAILKIDAAGLKAVVLGDSDGVKLGQTAIAIGNSLGEFRNTVSAGVISGLARTITASSGNFGSETISGAFQTDAAINPGNSGGPLLNLRGEVIGINTAMASGAQSIGFAIPINSVKRAIDSVKKTGEIKTPFIGVRYMTVTKEISEKEKLEFQYGALLRGSEDGPAVIDDSPAAQAGLQAEDVVLEVNGRKIDGNHSLLAEIQRFNVGDAVDLKVWRSGKILNLKLILEERPQE